MVLLLLVDINFNRCLTDFHCLAKDNYEDTAYQRDASKFSGVNIVVFEVILS